SCFMLRRPPPPPLFPYTTLFRSRLRLELGQVADRTERALVNERRNAHLVDVVSLAELVVVDFRVAEPLVVDVAPDVVNVPVIDGVERDSFFAARGPEDLPATDGDWVPHNGAPAVRRFARCAQT